MEITATGTAHEHAHSGGHDHAHEELGFLRTWVFSLDHKVIGIQYAVTGLLFLLFGFTLMMVMRWQLASVFLFIRFNYLAKFFLSRSAVIFHKNNYKGKLKPMANWLLMNLLYK